MQNTSTRREAPRFTAHELDLGSSTCDRCGRHVDAHLGVDAYCPDQPRVGDLATVVLWSDRKPARVIAVSPSGSKVTLAALDYTVASGSMHDGSATYRIAFQPREDALHEYATRRRDGTYRLQGWERGGRVFFGSAEVYRDPSF